jgi:hypothetical protein
VALDAFGGLQAVARRIRYTLRELAGRYGSGRLSRASREALKNAPYKPVDVIHVVMGREGRAPGREDSRNMPVASYFYEIDGEEVLGEGGYREMPYFFTTWTSGVTMYGHGPGDVALGEIRTLNAMERDILIGLKKSTDPPMLVPSSHRKNFSTRAGARNEVSDVGREAARPAQEIHFLPGLRAVSAKVQEVAARIDDILLGRVFADPFLDQLPGGVTATAILAQRQQKAQMMGPAVSSYETRILIPLIMRFKSLLDGAGMLPPLPPALAGLRTMPRGLLTVAFDSPMAQSLRQDEVQKINAFLESIGAVIQLDARARDKINMDQVVDELARALGVAGSLVRSDLEVALIRQGASPKTQQEE